MSQGRSRKVNPKAWKTPFLKILSSLLVFGLGAFLLWRYWDFITANVRIDPTLVTVDILGILWSCVFIGLKYQATFWLIGLRLPSSDAVAMGVTNRLLNQFLSNLGEIAVALYMKRSYGVLLMAYGGLFVATWCLSVLFNLVLVGMIAMLFIKGSWVWMAPAIVILVPLAAMTILTLRRYLFRPLGGRFAPLLQSMKTIFQYPSIVVWLILLDVGYILGIAVRYWAGFRMVGVDLPWGKSLALVPFANVISMLGITPLGAGLTEYVLGLLGHNLGYPLAQGALAASLDRGIMLVVLVGLGPLGYSWLMLRPAKKKPLDPRRASSSGLRPQFFVSGRLLGAFPNENLSNTGR